MKLLRSSVKSSLFRQVLGAKVPGRKNQRQPAAFLATALLMVELLCQVAALPAQADALDMQVPALHSRQPQQPAIQFRREATLEMMLPRYEYQSKYLQPVPLQGVRIPGLGPKALQLLGFNYFVVVNNTRYLDSADLYRENRLRGKSNFVTTDSIIHPYLAFTNRVLVEMIQNHLQPDLKAFLKALLERSLVDYKQADDEEVRNDLEHITAFLSVAVKLLDTGFVIPKIGDVPLLAETDMKSIQSGQRTNSAIFERIEDFSCYQPTGWYNSSPELQNFYRCREWISRMGFPVSESAPASEVTRANNFRRSVLLYRTLDTAVVQGTPAYEFWKRLQRAWSLLGSPLAAWQETTLLPLEYKSIFTNLSDLKVTLTSLSQPFYRTKLLLSIRKQRPVKLGSASIFELEDAKGVRDSTAIFRLLPVTGDPELPWMHSAAGLYRDENSGQPSWPLALLDLHAWGAGQANNVLLQNMERLDQSLVKVLPELDKSVSIKTPNGQTRPVDDRRWTILSTYFKGAPDGAQGALRTDIWLTRQLESAFAGWVDSHLALAPASYEEKPAAATSSQTASEESKAVPTAVKPAFYHYLEPAPETFKKIREDAQKLMQELQALGYFQVKSQQRFTDFIRLSQRLEKIADLELKGQTVPYPDLKLLSNIDLVLEKVAVPVAGTFPIAAPILQAEEDTQNGVNLALGRPGLLYVILQTSQHTILARGAVYTYYEIGGPPISAARWQHKLDVALIKPPYWADKFDVVQQVALPKKPVTAAP